MTDVKTNPFKMVIGETIYKKEKPTDIREEIRCSALSSHIKVTLLKCIQRNLHAPDELYTFIRCGLHYPTQDPDEYFKAFVSGKFLINFLATNNE